MIAAALAACGLGAFVTSPNALPASAGVRAAAPAMGLRDVSASYGRSMAWE